MKIYTYRSTEDKLSEGYQDILESGDTVLHVLFKGGRDYLLICQRGADSSELPR